MPVDSSILMVSLIVITNAAAVVWGAAKLHTAVQVLTDGMGKVERGLERVAGVVHEHDTRITVIERTFG